MAKLSPLNPLDLIGVAFHQKKKKKAHQGSCYFH